MTASSEFKVVRLVAYDTVFTVPLFDQFMRRIMPGDDWQWNGDRRDSPDAPSRRCLRPTVGAQRHCIRTACASATSGPAGVRLQARTAC